MFLAIFAYNVNSCALDISLYFVCEKKTNKSWHRKKAYRRHFLIGQKPHCLLLCARIKESYDYSLNELTVRENEPALIPRKSGWTRAIAFVGLSQSCYRLQIFVWQRLSPKLSTFQLRHRQGQRVTRPAVSLRGRSKTTPGRRRKSSLKVNASDIFEIVPGTLRVLMLLHASILWLGKSGKSDTRYLACKKVTCFHD